jgi:type III pantothenate kinase
MQNNTIFIDIGNSFVKIKAEENYLSCAVDEQSLKKLNDIVVEYKVDTAVVSSVNSDNENMLCGLLKEKNVKIIYSDDLLLNQKIIDFSDIQGMGNDRKFGLLGAELYFETPMIVVDCGTAITTNILGNDYKCYGGTIMLGVGTHSRALNIVASDLPKIKIKFDMKDVKLDNTNDAIN